MTPTALFAARRLKYAATINDEALSESTDSDFELAYIDIGNVDSQGRVHDIVNFRFEDAPSRARRIVRDGDVIISTVRTYLQAIAPVENPPENLIVSTGFAVVRPSNVLDHRFCKYALRANRFLWEVESRSTGVSYPAINASDLGDIKVSLPEVGAQRLIANYLDRETARIDGLIAEKERMLALLEEKRAALISRVVTRGINPDVTFKPSGLEWLDEIPAHWQEPRAKGLFREVDRRTETGEETLLSLRMGKGLVPHNEVSEKLLEASDVTGFKKIEPGQMVVNRMRAASGLIAVATESGLVSPDYAVFDVVDQDLSIEYFLELFKTSLLQAVFRSSSKGLGTGEQGFLRLYTDAFLSLHFPYPPVAEQRAVASFIEQQRSEMLQMENLLGRSIDLAKERRAALISAAVTGQIPLEGMTG
ncbi:MAG: restriction endonuclease subunit S domain-containing protein [Metallibacterium sp.]